MEILLKKYNGLSTPVKASLWFTICNVLQKGISFFTMPIFTRIMSSEQYGLYSVFLSWYRIISIFATLNMWAYLLSNGMIKYENDRDGFLSSLQGLSTTITALLFFLYLCFNDVWEKATNLSLPIMVIMFIEILFMPSFEYWCGRARFEYRFKSVVAMSLVISVLVPFISIPMIIVAPNKAIAAIIGRTLIPVIVYSIPFVIILKGKKFYNKEYWKYALKFNIPLLPHFLSGIILQEADRVMIANISGSDKAGIYSVAYTAAVFIQIVNAAILASFIPYTYNSIKNKEYSNIGKNANYLLIVIAVMNLMLILVAPEAMSILGPSEYREAMYIMPPVAISGVFMFMFNLFANIEYYFEENKFITIASVLSAVANIILNFVFINKYGYIAAGYTTLVCYVFYSIGHYIFMGMVCKRYLDDVRIYNGRFLCVFSAVVILLTLMMLFTYNYWYIRYGIVLVVTIYVIINKNSILNRLRALKKKQE